MLRHPSTIKRARQNKKLRAINKGIKSGVRKAIKQTLKSKDNEQLKKTHSLIDKAVKRSIFHKNTAARKKSRLAKLVNTATVNS